MSDYPLGSKVSYVDDTATVSDGHPKRVTGTVNGNPVINGSKVYVPVFSERDNGREPTTVYVSADNILRS